MRNLYARTLAQRKLPVESRLGIPRSGATRRGAYACDGGGREGGGAGVLCGGNEGHTEFGDWRNGRGIFRQKLKI